MRYFFCMIFLAACSSESSVVQLGDPAQSYRSNDYPKVLERWTRRDRIIKKLDTTLEVFATCFSPDFQAAYIARYQQLFALNTDDRSRLEKKMREDSGQYYWFHVSAATGDYRWNDFERKESIWRIQLVNENNDQLAPQVVLAEKDNSPLLTELFPHVSPFARVYTVRFPKKLADQRPFLTPDSSHFVLRFAGPLGMAELTWRLR